MVTEAPSFTQKIEANADAVVADSLGGTGPLKKYFAQLRRDLIEDEKETNELQRGRNPNTPKLSEVELNDRANRRLEQIAEKNVKPALISAAQGDSSAAKMDLEEGQKLAGAVNNTVTAWGTGNLIGLVISLVTLKNFTVVNDFVNSMMDRFMGGTRVQDTKFNRGMETVANQLKVDAEPLKQAMLAESEPQAPSKKTVAKVVVPREAKPNVAPPTDVSDKESGQLPKQSPGTAVPSEVAASPN